MKQVRIFCKSTETSQSGQANSGQWILQAERTSPQNPEPLMGWTQASDTLNQIRLEFSTRDEAEAFAKSKGWRYTLSIQNKKRIKPRNYGDNFICDMVENNA